MTRTARRAVPALAVAVLAVPGVALAASRSVAVKDDKFVAKSITVSRGTTVKWVWRGRSPHNVTVVKGPVRFRSSTKSSGSYSRKLTRRGTYRLLCTIHAPDMRMTVRVR
jgi:plastocyanin